MLELTVSGESIEEIDELSTRLRHGEKLAESDLGRVFERLIDVKETTKQMTSDGSSVSSTDIEERAGYDSVSLELQLLQKYEFVNCPGKGGNWEYVGN